MIRVPSTDGIAVAVHDLAGTTGDPLVVFAHATGFHGRCYGPMAESLSASHHSMGLDFQGHGATPRPPDDDVDWNRYGNDVLAVAAAIAPDGDLVGFGHSMGGTALLMAAFHDPGRFRLLVLYEPVVFPADPLIEDGADATQNPMVVGARRRRPTFPSIAAAYDHYASKAPMDAFDPAALRAYVTYGFGPDPDDPGAVRLMCDPEHEARTFEQGGAHHDTWELLPEIEVPVAVLVGRPEETGPSSISAAVAERLPGGRLVPMPELDHFGPMTHPGLVAGQLADAIGRSRHSVTPPSYDG